jgi:hypothetical protein
VKHARPTLTSLLPTPRRPRAQRVARLSVLVVPLLLAGVVATVRAVAREERLLSAEGARARRVVTYRLGPGGVVKVPIERGSEVVRVVVHAIRRARSAEATRGQGAPAPVARLAFAARGARGETTEELALPLPVTADRARAEEADLWVGDPLSFNLDVHAVGEGALSATLLGLDGADAIAVRFYRRDALDDEAASAATRPQANERRHLAVRAGELGFLDVDPEEQRALLGTRWRKLSALRSDGAPPRALALALASAPVRDERPRAEAPFERISLQEGEVGAWIAQGPAALELDDEGDRTAAARAPLRATLRDLDGTSSTRTGLGTLRLELAAGRRVAIEVGRGTPGAVALRTATPAAMAPIGHAVAWRVAPGRPLRVDGGALSRVLRLIARAPLPRARGPAARSEPVELALQATITTSDGVAATAPLRATRDRARYDRYERPRHAEPERADGDDENAERAPTDGASLDEPLETPSEPATFHVLLPAHTSLVVETSSGPIDVSLAELDPEAPPLPSPTFRADAPPHALREIGAAWPGYRPRRPSNAELSGPEGRRRVRVPPRLVEVAFPPPGVPTFRVERPNAWDTLVLAKRIFEPHTATYEIQLPAGEALVLPVRLFSYEPMEIVARVDAGTDGTRPIARSELGFPTRTTLARAYPVDREVRSVMVLGEDLAPGTHRLTFTPPPGKKAWIHLPWTIHPRAPSATPTEPRWIEGELDD